MARWNATICLCPATGRPQDVPEDQRAVGVEGDEVGGGEVVDGAAGISLGFVEAPGVEMGTRHGRLQEGPRRSVLGGCDTGQPLDVDRLAGGDLGQPVKGFEDRVRLHRSR